MISSAKQLKAQHVFTTEEGIVDHLDLLVNDNPIYWNTITQEVRLFLPDATGNMCAPDLDESAFIDFADFLIFATRFGQSCP